MTLDTTSDEIDLSGVLTFLYSHAKALSAAGVAGAILGAGVWYVVAPYKAELVINVESRTPRERTLYERAGYREGERQSSSEQSDDVPKPAGPEAVDYLTWRGVELGLPQLAGQMVKSRKVQGDQATYFEAMSDVDWWRNHVAPTYVLGKHDAKTMVEFSKELQAAEGGKILNLIVSDSRPTEEAADNAVRVAAAFIQKGAATLAIRSLINRYMTEVDVSKPNVQKRISEIEIDLRYRRMHAAGLERLRSRFPQGLTSQQIVDVRELNAKYMPVVAQLIATYADIAKEEETLLRLRAQLAQDEIERKFLVQAEPVLVEEMDGQELAKRLLGIEASLRNETPANDLERLRVLDVIRADVMSINVRWARGLVPNAVTRPPRAGRLSYTLGGLIGGVVLALVWLSSRRGTNGPRSTC